MTTQEARSIIKDFVSRWSDQKIAEVKAFNQDGKMSYLGKGGCCCLLGVHLSTNLHQFCKDREHYGAALNEPEGMKVQMAYLVIGGDRGNCRLLDDPIRQQILDEILGEVMDERAAARAQMEPLHELVSQ